MPLVNLDVMLKRARREKYGVGCFNIVDLQSARAIVSAAEEKRSPVILAIAEVHLKYVPLETIVPIALSLARSSTVPIAIILDHGKSFSTNINAMNLGCSAVMFDGSIYGFTENIQRTAEVVKIAHTLGVSVEAELGHVARPHSNPDKEESDLEDPIYTNPKDVVEFVAGTNVDALAISFGTMHGLCTESPKLNFDLLTQINSISPVPLVMHGASGLSDEDLQQCISCGITKINYYSDIAHSAALFIQQKLNDSPSPAYYHDIAMWGYESMKENTRKKMQLFGSSNQA